VWTIPKIVSSCRSGRYGCSMWAELVIIVSNSASSASLWSSVIDGRSVAQKPVLLQRLRNRSRRSRSAAEQMPVQAGAQYMIFATIVARNTIHLAMMLMGCRDYEVLGRLCKDRSVLIKPPSLSCSTQWASDKGTVADGGRLVHDGRRAPRLSRRVADINSPAQMSPRQKPPPENNHPEPS